MSSPRFHRILPLGQPHTLSEWYDRRQEQTDLASSCEKDASTADTQDDDLLGADWPGCGSRPLPKSRYFIGDESGQNSPRSSRGGYIVDSEVRRTLKGICCEYFENNISPVLRYVQKAQERLEGQLEELRSTIDRKADVNSVLNLKTSQDAVRQQVAQHYETAASLVQLQELSAALSRKAEASHVPTLAQLKAVATALDQKMTAMADDLAAFFADRKPTPKEVSPCADGAVSLEAKKMQVIVAAAGARFDKQLRELRHQIRELQASANHNHGHHGHHDHHHGQHGVHGHSDPRWPGRVVDAASLNSFVDNSDVASEGGHSLAPSMLGSVCGFDAEQRAELKKFQAIVGAAGSVFSKDLRELRRQVAEVRDEMGTLKARTHVKKEG